MGSDKEIAKLTEEHNTILAECKTLPFDTAEQRDFAATYLLELRSLLDNAEGMRAAVADPIYKAWKNAREQYAPVITPLQEACTWLKTSLEAATAKALKQAEEELEKIAHDTEALAKFEVPDAAPKGMSLRSSRVKYRVVDESLIPRKYLTVNHALIQREIGEGVEEIPGLEFYRDTQLQKARS